MVRLQLEPIDLASLIDEARGPGDGALALFVGKVRDHHQGRSVRYLEYHAYEEMALAEMRKVVAAAEETFDVRRIAAVHRLGKLQIGEDAVAVVVVASHRAPAFDACRQVIDQLKLKVPIWKRETFTDGEGWVEGDRVVD